MTYWIRAGYKYNDYITSNFKTWFYAKKAIKVALKRGMKVEVSYDYPNDK